MADGAVVALDVGVLLRLSGLDVGQGNALLRSPGRQRCADVFGAVACWERCAADGYGRLRSLKIAQREAITGPRAGSRCSAPAARARR